MTGSLLSKIEKGWGRYIILSTVVSAEEYDLVTKVQESMFREGFIRRNTVSSYLRLWRWRSPEGWRRSWRKRVSRFDSASGRLPPWSRPEVDLNPNLRFNSLMDSNHPELLQWTSGSP
jgi:hypothetical protein